MYKKLLALLTASCICLSITMSANAAVIASQDLLEESRVNQIENALAFVEETKSAFGLDDVDFNNLDLGTSVITYEYIDGVFKASGEMVPIIWNNEIVASAFDAGNGNYSIETSLAASISETGFDDVAIVYDRDEVYLFNGLDFVLLKKSNICVAERDDIDLNTIKDKPHHITTTNMIDNDRIRLSLGDKRARATLPYAECDVKYVTQLPYENLCWAACVAMVKNYISGTSLTAPDVSRKTFGTLKDATQSGTEVQKCMRNHYGLNYTYNSYAPGENVIFNNLSDGHPIIGVFSPTSGDRHACVIIKSNPFSYFINILDPMSGLITINGSGGQYKYVSSVSHKTFTLSAGLCYSWT